MSEGSTSTTLSDPLVGRVLDGRYHVEARLARGGMATVYTARDTRLDRTVAVKVMHPNYAEDEAFVARFIREARSAALLSHPNVVAVYDQGDDEGIAFLAMEYVAGRTLRDVLKERERLGTRDALEVLERILSALSAAHHAGLVHRDVKPENVLISDEGRVKVADFGLARAIAATSQTTGVILGTVAYLSPEQVLDGSADTRSDVYSAGILLYEMLVGETPFHGGTPIAIAYKHVHEEVPRPSVRLPSLPAEVDDLVRNATSRNPRERYADAAEMLGEVAAARRGLAAHVDDAVVLPAENSGDDTLVLSGTRRDLPAKKPADTDSQRPVPRRRRRWRGPLVLILVLLLAAGAGVAGWWYGEGRWTQTPRLGGMERVAAAHKATRLGFDTNRATRYDESVPKGDVIATKPAAGDRVLRGSTLTLLVSRGPERHPVPKVVGVSQSTAKTRIAAHHLSVGKVKHRYSETVDKGDVISSDPKAGKEIKRDATVDLVVSKGIPPVNVPALAGLTAAAAKGAVEKQGLAFASTQAYSKTVPEGEIIGQQPGAGSDVKRGSTVTVTVSQGPPIVDVPDVKGQPLGKAKKALKDAGFKVQVKRIPMGRGTVVQQSKTGQARWGTTIQLWVL
ncbi:MAG: Stk1 family PASTA domain-containing Ser/Thr kinase [Streptosporangiales bacterium]